MKEFYPDSWHYSPPGGPFGKIGVHDDEWIIAAGRHCVFVAIESKSDTGVLSEPQRQNLMHVKRCGGVAAIMVGKDIDKLYKIKLEIDKRIVELEKLEKSNEP